MDASTDLLIGIFLIVSGFIIAIINLRNLIKNRKGFTPVLISENLVLTCIGVAFLSRAYYRIYPKSMEARQINGNTVLQTESLHCDFRGVLLSFSPFVLSSVNSFVSLIIDSYINLRMSQDSVNTCEQNMVEELGNQSVTLQARSKTNENFNFLYKYNKSVAVLAHWMIPIAFSGLMLLMDTKEVVLPMESFRNNQDSCISVIEMNRLNCTHEYSNHSTISIQDFIENDYLIAIENNTYATGNKSDLSGIIKNIYSVINNFNKTQSIPNENTILRNGNVSEYDCVKICFMDSKLLLIYMLCLIVACYFIPITISIVLLIKAHNITPKNYLNTSMNKKLMYNILFWSPTMFDAVISLIFCSYSSVEMRSSILSVIANVYQVFKNFLNAKLSQNVVAPIS